LTAPRSISTGMSDVQSQMNAAMEEARRADQKKREAAEALRARQHEYETANLRGRQQQIKRARAAMEAAERRQPMRPPRVTCSGLVTKRRRSSRLKLGRRTCNSGSSAAVGPEAWRGRAVAGGGSCRLNGPSPGLLSEP